MYKAIQNKSLYLAVETFPKTRRTVTPVYKSGIRIWESAAMKIYSIVVYRFRIMLGFKHTQLSAEESPDE